MYLVLTSQVQARSSIVGNSASAVDAQEVFKGTFKALIDEDYSISNDIQRYKKDGKKDGKRTLKNKKDGKKLTPK